MQQHTEEIKKVGAKHYCCSNPNCKSVFSKPKIIKYYVCPSCQTLVEMTTTEGKIVKTRKPKSKRRKKTEKPKLTEKRETRRTNTILTEQPITSEETIDTPTEQPITSEETANRKSISGCQYYFGYLGQREKGKGIPNSCLDCAKSLDCMLYDYYKSKE